MFVCYLYKNSKNKKGGKIMGNEKLENQKIDEGKMENVAGGYAPSGSITPYGSLTVDSLKLSKKEYEMLEKADCITRSEIKGENFEYISRSKLEKALNILNKKSKCNTSYDGLEKELNIYY